MPDSIAAAVYGWWRVVKRKKLLGEKKHLRPLF
jgi:hypothetical protein